jgi:predicted site-specific integrase-resolvase
MERRGACPKEAAQLLGCCAETVRRHVRAGRVRIEREISGRAIVVLEKSELTGRWRLAAAARR